MGFSEVADLDCTKTTALGGKDKKTGKTNPTKIEGYYIGTKKVESAKSKTGFASLHVFETPNGNVGVWGKTNLDQKMLSVTPGVMTRVSYVGMVETKNNPMYKYKVEVDAGNIIDAGVATQEGIDSQESSYASGDDESSVAEGYEEEPEVLDEVAPTRAKPPVRAAATPSPAQQARVQALLASRPNKAS